MLTIQTFLLLKYSHKETKQMIKRALVIVDRWSNALWATGSTLQPEKYWWCQVEFEWVGSKWRYKKKDERMATSVMEND